MSQGCGNEIRLTNALFDMERAPVARGCFVSDNEDDFTPFFSKSHGTDPCSGGYELLGHRKPSG